MEVGVVPLSAVAFTIVFPLLIMKSTSVMVTSSGPPSDLAGITNTVSPSLPEMVPLVMVKFLSITTSLTPE